MIIPSPVNSKEPKIHEKAFISPAAMIIGDVEIGEGTNVWAGVTVRGALCSVKIGKNCSIQENCVIHSEAGTGVIIEDNVLIGHGAIVHGPGDVGEGTMVGIGAIKLQGKKVGKGCVIGAGAVVTKHVEERKKVVGIPAKEIGEISDREYKQNLSSIANYAGLGKAFLDNKLDHREGKNPLRRPRARRRRPARPGGPAADGMIR